MTSVPSASFAVRWSVYLAERFPPLRTTLLVAAFSSASVNVSALLAGRELPGAGAYVAAFLLGLILMFHLRVLDEIKDAETDRLHRPERPIPRGLIQLREVMAVGAALVPGALLVAAAHAIGVAIWLVVAWGFMALMTAHFFVPGLLKRSLALTLASHMAVMPLVDLVLTACEWVPSGDGAPAGLWLFLLLTYANGCVLEIGRKTWARDNERPGVETYSSAWGPTPAVMVWLGAVFVAAALIVLLAARLGAMPVGFIAMSGALAMAVVALRYRRRPDQSAQAWLDRASGLWILLSYLCVGYLPLVLGATP